MSMRIPFIANQIRQLCDAAGGEIRMDANETVFLARQIEQVRSKIYEVVYAELRARSFVPMATDIAATAETYVYYVMDMVGEAKVIANGANDLPRVDVSQTERTGKVRTIGDSYGWTLIEMREAARVGQPLAVQKARAARRAIEQQIDKMLASGDTDSQNLTTEGLLNNTDVTGLGIAAGTFWVLGTTTPATMFAEINGVVNTIVTATKHTWIPDAVLLPTATYEVFRSTPYGTDSDMTALRWFLANNEYIKSVQPWYRGDGAGASAKNRGVVYKKDPDVLEGIIPMEFEQLPPETKGLNMVVNCIARAGGVKVYHPEAMRYVDFALS
jgi:hypothetical protein